MSAMSLTRTLLRTASTSHSNYASIMGSGLRHFTAVPASQRTGLTAATAALPGLRQHVVSRTIWSGAKHPVISKPEAKEIERVPLPDGIPMDRFRAYQIKDSGAVVVEGEPPCEDAILAVHGPPEVWAPHGLVEGHGASGGIFAVIATGGNQFKVSPGDVLYTNRQKGEVNSQVVFDSVLIVASVDWSVFGQPAIGNARVIATIEEQSRSGKTYLIKFKKRTGYRRKKGHRQRMTRFRIDKVDYEVPGLSQLVELKEKESIPTKPEPNIRFPLV